MRLKLVLASLGLFAGVASAQPTEPGSGTTDVTPTPQPQPPPPQPPPPTDVPVMPPQQAPPTGMHDHDHEHEHDGMNRRPSDIAFAIGLGYSRGPGGSLDLQTPNIASARLRLVSGITFEPIVTIGNSSHDQTLGMNDSTETTTVLDLGTLVRFPVIRHGHVDFEVLGSIGVDVIKDDPQGDYNTITTTDFALGWGIGIGYWFSPHWQLSISATNPLLSYSSRKTDTGPDTSDKDSVTSFDVAFNPTTTVMLHLYN